MMHGPTNIKITFGIYICAFLKIWYDFFFNILGFLVSNPSLLWIVANRGLLAFMIGSIYEIKWTANLMQLGNFIDVFLARHVSGTYAHRQEH